MSHAPRHLILCEISCGGTYIVTTTSIEKLDRQAIALGTSLDQVFGSTCFGFDQMTKRSMVECDRHLPSVVCVKEDEDAKLTTRLQGLDLVERDPLDLEDVDADLRASGNLSI